MTTNDHNHLSNSIEQTPVVHIFPNGNSVECSSPAVLSYVSQYKSFLKQTAKSIIGLGTTIIEADQTLGRKDFDAFLREVNLSKTSSTYSKLTKIGEAAMRFESCIDRLPNSWTTLYTLAKMPREKFEIIEPQLEPMMTALQIRELTEATKASQQSSRSTSIIATIDFTKFDLSQLPQIMKELADIKSRYQIAISPNNFLKQELANRNLELAA